MMKTHIVINEVIVNTIIATVEEAQTAYPDAICIDASLGGAIGWGYVDGELIEPDPPPIPIVLGELSTDTWSIPADGETFATITYTSDSTVYFAVESEIHTVEPIDQIATLEVTADAIGPIRIDVRGQQLLIAALEV